MRPGRPTSGGSLLKTSRTRSEVCARSRVGYHVGSASAIERDHERDGARHGERHEQPRRRPPLASSRADRRVRRCLGLGSDRNDVGVGGRHLPEYTDARLLPYRPMSPRLTSCVATCGRLERTLRRDVDRRHRGGPRRAPRRHDRDRRAGSGPGSASSSLLGLAWRIFYVTVIGTPDGTGGDPFYYHAQANLLAERARLRGPVRLAAEPRRSSARPRSTRRCTRSRSRSSRCSAARATWRTSSRRA